MQTFDELKKQLASAPRPIPGPIDFDAMMKRLTMDTERLAQRKRKQTIPQPMERWQAF